MRTRQASDTLGSLHCTTLSLGVVRCSTASQCCLLLHNATRSPTTRWLGWLPVSTSD
jgi:hypothetical protein